MASLFGGTGRPDQAEPERRRREFVALVAAGAAFDDAARTSRIDPRRALKFLCEPEMRALVAEVRDAG